MELDASSHRAIDVYDNALLLIAIRDYLERNGNVLPARAIEALEAAQLKLELHVTLFQKNRTESLKYRNFH